MATTMAISISSNSITSHVRLDLAVDPGAFVPIIKVSVIKAINLALKDIISLDYTLNSKVDGIEISIINGKRTVETNLPRDEAILLLKDQIQHGCIINVILEILPTDFDS